MIHLKEISFMKDVKCASLVFQKTILISNIVLGK